MSLKKFLLFLISLFVGIELFIWIYNTVGWEEIKNAFLVFTGWQGLVILGLTLLIIFIGNWKWKEILKGENVRISCFSLFKPYLVGFSVMFFAPAFFWAGEIFRSYVLKEKKQIAFPKALASVIIDRMLEWTTNLVVIFFGVLFFLYKIGFPPKNLVIIFGGAFLLFAGGVAFFYLKIFKRESIIKGFSKIFGSRLGSESVQIEEEIFNFFKPQKKSMWKGFGLAFLRALMVYLRTWLLIFFLGKEISALSIVSILGFTFLAMMIPIPASLGSHETIQVFAFNSLGLGSSTATAFTMIIRGAELIIALIGAIILFQLGFFLLKNNLLRKVRKFIPNKD